MLKTISSFKEVEVTNCVKTLILCDIDGTILHFPDCDNFCKEFIKECLTKYNINCPMCRTDIRNN